MLLIALLASLPVTLPEEWGRLVVSDAVQTPAASTLVLEYVNDTGVELRDVRLECTLFDHRASVVDTASMAIKAASPGHRSTQRLRIVDSSQRATRAECRIASAKRQAVP